MFNPALIKPAVMLTTRFCTSRVVTQLVYANTPTAVTTFQKVSLFVGAYGLGSAAAHAASNAVLSDIADVELAVAEYKAAQKVSR